MIRLLALLTVLAVAGCTAEVSYDREVDALGARIVTELKALPSMSDASYTYEHGLDLGQHLRVKAVLKRESAAEPDIQQAIDTAARTFWLSPANVGHLVVTVFSSADPAREIGTKNIEDSVAFDRPEMDQKYGPRPRR